MFPPLPTLLPLPSSFPAPALLLPTYSYPTPAQFLLLPCSCPAQLLPFLTLLLVQLLGSLHHHQHLTTFFGTAIAAFYGNFCFYCSCCYSCCNTNFLVFAGGNGMLPNRFNAITPRSPRVVPVSSGNIDRYHDRYHDKATSTSTTTSTTTTTINKQFTPKLLPDPLKKKR